MKCFIKKGIFCLGATLIMASTVFCGVAKASFAVECVKSIVPSVISDVLVNTIGGIWDGICEFAENVQKTHMVNSCKGMYKSSDIIGNLEKFINNESNIKVYGQENAKNQMFDVLSGIVARIDSVKRMSKEEKQKRSKEIRGNIVYLIGPSGTGKTKMCYAIAEAFMKHPNKTAIFCHSADITGDSELGTQLFKTVIKKDIGKRRKKNVFTGSDGIVPKEEESPLLKHIMTWHEAVVIIDEYDKMKEKSARPGSMMNLGGGVVLPTGDKGKEVDNSADEILRSIASTGKYRFMDTEVDCSKVLFLVTTNETKEELEQNFGISGVKGGGVQRLNVIEFKKLDEMACMGIVKDMIDETSNIVTDSQGLYQLRSIDFDEESKKSMAKYICSDDIKQGRVKIELMDKIYAFLNRNKRYCGKNVEMSFDCEKQDVFIRET